MTRSALTPIPPRPSATSDAHRHGEAIVSIGQLHWFITLRWLMVCVAVALLAIERVVAVEATRPVGLLAVVAAVAGMNVIWLYFIRRLRRQAADPGSERSAIDRGAAHFANAQVAFDLLLLTGLVRYTGGIESPLALFYMFHMAIGSLLLARWQAVLQGVWAVLLLAAVSIGELTAVLTPHYNFLPHLPMTSVHLDPLFVLPVLCVFVCGVFGILYFTLHVAALLEDRENKLHDANAALRASQQAIRALQEKRARFMQTAAHQLKSPLAAIETLAGLIRDEIVPAEQIRPTCAKITTRCREGIRQVSELLMLARVEEADPTRHRQTAANVVEIVAELCQRYRLSAEEKGLTFNVSIPTGTPLNAAVDARDLTDCIDNLISNAIKYTPAPGTVTVSMSCGKSSAQAMASAESGSRGGCDGRPEFLAVMVRDTGIGIEADALPDAASPHPAGSIFEDFRRSKTALHSGVHGTGLGLSIVREVVEQAGGETRVSSVVGQGSTFVVSFPARREPRPTKRA